MRRALTAFLAAALLAAPAAAAAQTRTCDVVVYGGTAGGVITAVAATKPDVIGTGSYNSDLLVPVVFSATHVACSTLRMEPQCMITGHAADVAAKRALDNSTAVQDVDARALMAKLRAQGAVLAWSPPATR
jgi:Spy/CpxP family protein refolding chaperone